MTTTTDDKPKEGVDLPITQPIMAESELEREVTQHNEKSVSGPLERIDSTVYPPLPKVLVIMFSLYISIFLVALDRTIISTAIPKITDEFHSINDIGWYGASYLLTACGFILFYGRIYTYFDTKWVFLSGIMLFEVGSAICGAAPTSIAFIVGRAIAGLGSSGIFTGAITIMISTVPLHKRPMYQGFFGACFGVASVAGPLMGGAFTDSSATWRWCFYINLPLGGFTILALIFLLHLDEKKVNMTVKEKLMKLDPWGMLLFLPSIICLLLALQWGGSKYQWSSWRIVVLMVFFAVLFVGFIVVQVLTQHTTAMVPARIILQRSVHFCCWYTFCSGAVMMSIVFYLPLWFQAIKGVNAVQSGIRTLPLVMSLVVAAIGCGGIVQRFGYYTPFIWLGSVLMSIGTGVLLKLTTSSGHAMWIGYQCLVGFGIGMGMQQCNLAVQTVLPKEDVPTGASLIFFHQTLGGAVFVAVAQNLFIDGFITQLRKLGSGIINPSVVTQTGATALRGLVPPAALPRVLVAYNYAIVHGPFLAAVCVACLSILGAVGVEWRSVKEGQPKTKKQQKEQAVAKDLETGSVTARDEKEGGMEPMAAEEEVESHMDEKERAADDKKLEV